MSHEFMRSGFEPRTSRLYVQCTYYCTTAWDYMTLTIMGEYCSLTGWKANVTVFVGIFWFIVIIFEILILILTLDINLNTWSCWLLVAASDSCSILSARESTHFCNKLNIAARTNNLFLLVLLNRAVNKSSPIVRISLDAWLTERFYTFKPATL